MRAVLGVIAGFAAWWVAFYVLIFLVVVIWPTSEEFNQTVLEGGDYSGFPGAMLAAFLLMYIPIGLVSGYVTTVITKKRLHAWIVAAPILAFAIFQHLYTFWNVLPNWYNLAVVIVVAPLIVMGTRLVRTSGADSSSLR